MVPVLAQIAVPVFGLNRGPCFRPKSRSLFLVKIVVPVLAQIAVPVFGPIRGPCFRDSEFRKTVARIGGISGKLVQLPARVFWKVSALSRNLARVHFAGASHAGSPSSADFAIVSTDRHCVASDA